jgi:hypothetical protein
MQKKNLKLLGSVLVALYCVYHFYTSGQWHFIDSVDLIIHEAGHLIFMFFGEFIAIAGGSIMQILIPILFAVSFYRTEQRYSSAVMMYWLSVNLFYVGQYASDAVAMNLPLLGGDNVIHDWNYLLSTTGSLGQTENIANVIYLFGMFAILAGLTISLQAYSGGRASGTE